MEDKYIDNLLQETREKEKKVDDFQKIFEDENALINLVFSEENGRFTIASRDINAGEIIHQAIPYCAVSKENLKLSICANCFSSKMGICQFLCDKCEQVYYCSQSCKDEDSISHTSTECRVLTRISKDTTEYQTLNDLTKMQLRLFVRLFGIAHDEKVSNRSKSISFKHVLYLVANRSKFIEKKPERLLDFKFMHNLLMNAFADEKEVIASNPHLKEEELFIELFCKLECNCFGIWDQKAFVVGVGVYPSISMLNHCCTPNAIYQKKGNRFICTALRDIEKGMEVNASYLNVDWPTEERQERISDNWLFECKCFACIDPTDFETERYNLKYLCPNVNCPGLVFPILEENSLVISKKKCFIFSNMPLFESKPIDENAVKAIVKENWDLEVGKCLKAFQNHVFLAEAQDKTKFIVRVVHEHDGKKQTDIDLEILLLDYLKSNNLPVCKSIPTKSLPSKKWICTESHLFIIVFEYAHGVANNFTDWKWLTEKEQVVGLGRWLWKLHHLTQRFFQENSTLHFRNYTQIHDGVLADVPIDKQDIESMKDPTKYGIIHGDVNLSNFFWDSEVGMPQMFDWDQIQLCWLLYDLAGPIWTVITMRNGGNPIDRSPVPQANVSEYTAWLLEGYEEGGSQVDREALKRMVELRRQLYKRFCKRAIIELSSDSPIVKFCEYMNSWLDKEIE